MRLSDRLSGDGLGLAIIGVSSLLRGVSYMPGIRGEHSRPAHLLEYFGEPAAWSPLWLAVGLLCIVAAIGWKAARPAAVGGAVGIHALWALSFLAIGGRGWVTALSYGSIALIALWAFGRGRRPEL